MPTTSFAEPAMGRGTTFAPPAPPRQPHGERAVSVLWSFGKCLGALLPVYLAGYYGFSISVVLFGLMIYMGWKHSRLDKMTRLKSAMYLLENEREFTTESVFRVKRDMPPWVRTHAPQFVSSVTSVRLNLRCTLPRRRRISLPLLNVSVEAPYCLKVTLKLRWKGRLSSSFIRDK